MCISLLYDDIREKTISLEPQVLKKKYNFSHYDYASLQKKKKTKIKKQKYK